MTSLPVLNIIYVLANFPILSDTSLFKYFRFMLVFWRNLISVNELHDKQYVRLRHYVNQNLTN